MWRWLVAAAIVGGGVLAPPLPGTVDRSVEIQARALVERLRDRRLEGATLRWTTEMAAKAPAPRLEDVWRTLESEVGPLEQIGSVARASVNGFELVNVDLRFEKGAMVARVAFDSAERIAGLYFIPHARKP